MRLLLGTICACMLTSLAAAQAPVSSAVSYQGRLTEGGNPANGPYDFYIRLYDSQTGGNAVGTPFLTFNDIQVVDGEFTLALDFGSAAYTGDARWVDVHVRPGASGGFYTPLSPRQPLTAAPYALFALNGGSWIADGAAIKNSNTGFVGINRSSPASGSEYFGIQAPVQSGYGGMYIRTDGAAAKPFYGYTAGNNNAWTYLDGTSGDWRVNNGGLDRFTVTDSGEIGIGTTSPAAKMHIQNPASNSDNSLYAVTYGAGKAASFESHQANSTPAVSIYKNQGTALQTTGDVKINGKVLAEFDGALKRATPIAYGCFTRSTSPVIKSGSGNFTVVYDNAVFFPSWIVTVDGETDPQSWIVVANHTYENARYSGPLYHLRTGFPAENGTFALVSECYHDCDENPYGQMQISFTVYKP